MSYVVGLPGHAPRDEDEEWETVLGVVPTDIPSHKTQGSEYHEEMNDYIIVHLDDVPVGIKTLVFVTSY